jgi:hypothetical protein
MSRLPRPNIPLAVQLYVAQRQVGCSPFYAEEFVEMARAARKLKIELEGTLFLIACSLGVPVKTLELHHRPALTNREKIIRGGEIVGYKPDANDPEHLIFLAEAAHDVETRVRGLRGQHSDLGLARKNKRIARNRDPKRRKAKIPNRKKPWPTGRKIPNRTGGFRGR